MNLQVASQQLKKPIDLSKLSRDEARVEIAKDVLARLKKGMIVAKNGDYLRIPRADKHPGEQQCQACGVGSILLTVMLRQQLPWTSRTLNPFRFETDMKAELSPFFTPAEVAEIETAFEHGHRHNIALDIRHDVGQEATMFCYDMSDEEGLIKIMQGIIDNKGKLPWR